MSLTLSVQIQSLEFNEGTLKGKEKVRVGITALPDEVKEHFKIKAKHIEEAHPSFTINISKETEKLLFVFRKKKALGNDKIFASSSIPAEKFPKDIDSQENTEVQTFDIYEPVQQKGEKKKADEREVVGKMELQFKPMSAETTESGEAPKKSKKKSKEEKKAEKKEKKKSKAEKKAEKKSKSKKKSDEEKEKDADVEEKESKDEEKNTTEDSDKKSEKDSDKKSEEDSDKKSEEDSDKKSEEDSDKKSEEDSDKKSEEDSDKKSEEDSDKKSEEDSDKKSDEDSDNKSDEDSESKSSSS